MMIRSSSLSGLGLDYVSIASVLVLHCIAFQRSNILLGLHISQYDVRVLLIALCIYGSLWLYMALYGFLWLLWLPMTLYGSNYLYMATWVSLWTSSGSFYCLELPMAHYGPI